VGKPSAVGQLKANSAFYPHGVDKWVVSCNQMAAITRQWWRRLVNVYEVKASMVCLRCKNCVIHTWELQRRASHNGALHKYHPLAAWDVGLRLYLLLRVCSIAVIVIFAFEYCFYCVCVCHYLLANPPSRFYSPQRSCPRLVLGRKYRDIYLRYRYYRYRIVSTFWISFFDKDFKS